MTGEPTVLIHLPPGSYTIPISLFQQLTQRHGMTGALPIIERYIDIDDRIKAHRPKIYYADMGANAVAEVPKISHVSTFAF